MPIVEFRCKLCGAPMETFGEMGKYAAACTKGECIGCFDYVLYDTHEEMIKALEEGEA